MLSFFIIRWTFGLGAFSFAFCAFFVPFSLLFIGRCAPFLTGGSAIGLSATDACGLGRLPVMENNAPKGEKVKSRPLLISKLRQQENGCTHKTE